MSKVPSPSIDWQRVLVVAIVILIGVEFILGCFMVNDLLYNVRRSSGGFTGAKIYANLSTSWVAIYTIRDRTNTTISSGGCGPSGYVECPIQCPSGHSIHINVFSNDDDIITLEIWVRGEIRNSTSGTHHISASAVC